VSFALSEFVVFAGAVAALPRGAFQSRTALDVARALGAGALTILLLRGIGPIPPWAGIPLCVAAFSIASLALGLMGRSDLEVLGTLLRRRGKDAALPAEADSWNSSGQGPGALEP
jgi:hypothetical protein